MPTMAFTIFLILLKHVDLGLQIPYRVRRVRRDHIDVARSMSSVHKIAIALLSV